MILVSLALAGVFWLSAQDAGIEVGGGLPPARDRNFPVLRADFDGDGVPDRAVAVEDPSGVQISVELSSLGETYSDALGAATLRQVEWRAISSRETFDLCVDPLDCPVDIVDGSNDARSAILVTLDETDSFILRWDGEALETYFVDL